MKRIIITICLSFSFATADADIGQELKERAVWLLDDAGSGFGLLRRENIFPATVFLSSVAISSLIDNNVRREVQRNKNETLTGITNITNYFGSATYIAPLSLSIYGLSLFQENKNFRDASFTAWESLVIAGFVSGGLKMFTGRARPYQEEGSLKFVPLRGNDSFPSGHTTVAFAFLTPYAEYLGPPYSYFLYLLASSTAFARVYRDVHWFSDVIAGAGVGFIVGRSLVVLHKKRRNPNIILSYDIQSGTANLCIKF